MFEFALGYLTKFANWSSLSHGIPITRRLHFCQPLIHPVTFSPHSTSPKSFTHLLILLVIITIITIIHATRPLRGRAKCLIHLTLLATINKPAHSHTLCGHHDCALCQVSAALMKVIVEQVAKVLDVVFESLAEGGRIQNKVRIITISLSLSCHTPTDDLTLAHVPPRTCHRIEPTCCHSTIAQTTIRVSYLLLCGH